jgi:hypothetical protein
MAGRHGDAVWRRRVRWRVRGALQWPLFVALTGAEAVLLHALPISSENTGLAGGLLLAMFFNLVAVAAAPVAGRLVRRRRPDLPTVVAVDRAGSALLLAVAAGLLAGGLAHRPGRGAERRSFAAQSAAARGYVLHHAAAAYRSRLSEADSVREDDDLYRTCVPGGAGRAPLCLLVDTSATPAVVRRDADHTPNRR